MDGRWAGLRHIHMVPQCSTTEYLWQHRKLDLGLIAVTSFELQHPPCSFDVDFQNELAILVDRNCVRWDDLSEDDDHEFVHEFGTPLWKVGEVEA